MRALWDKRFRRAARSSIGLTAFDQSQRSWARAIASYDDVPAAFRSFFEPFLTTRTPFPLTVIAPTYEGFLRRQTEKLICSTPDEVDVLEERRGMLIARRYPMAGIMSVEVHSALLDAWIKITGLEGDGRVPVSSTIRFNAVTDFLFGPILARIRGKAGASQETATGQPDRFLEWGKRSFKFMNYAQRSLMRDEVVLHAVLQPEIRRRLASAFGKTYWRTMSPTHATILTDRELIAIREIVHRGGPERYGGVCTYMPLHRVERVSLEAGHHDLVTLSIGLAGGASTRLLFEPSAMGDLQVLVERFLDVKRRGPGNGAAREQG